MNPNALRCEYLLNPLGVDVLQPRLSWQPPFDQAAYQIVVTGAWDSGRVRSADTLHVLVNDGQLLDRIIDADRLRWQTEMPAELRVRNSGDTGRPMSRQINGGPVEWLMPEGGENALAM